MKKIVLIILTIACTILTAAAVSAEYEITVTEADWFIETDPTWYCNISIPVISGMADEVEQEELNADFISAGAVIRDAYEDAVGQAKADFPDAPEDQRPHFGYKHSFERVMNTDRYFVFSVTDFYQAGSSMTAKDYYTFDKTTGKLLTLDDFFGRDDYLAALTGYIVDEMNEWNEVSDNDYWVDLVPEAMAAKPESRSWYPDPDGNLVIFFQKYEVAPGAMGMPEFYIPADRLAELQ